MNTQTDFYASLTTDSTLAHLPFFDFRVTAFTPGRLIARTFESHPELLGMLVMRADQLVGMLSRRRFLESLGLPYGVELYLHRPIEALFEMTDLSTLVLAATTRIDEAVQAGLSRPIEWVYEPIVTRLEDGGLRLIDFSIVLLAQSHLLKKANQVVEEQKAIAESANIAKSQFLANMSHELRTPLNAIIGYSEILQEKAEEIDQPEFVSDLQKIRAAGKHLLGLINDILDLSKIEAGRMDLYLEHFDINTLVQEVVTMVQPLFEKSQNTLEIRCLPNLGTMYSDVTKIRQSLFNLLSNANRFTDKGSVRLNVNLEWGGAEEPTEALGPPNFIVFQVQDTGIGMTLEQTKKLFHPFTQADASTTRKYGGTGLGLAITQRFCQMLGGTIGVVSEVEQGSTFTIRLPRSSVANPLPLPPERPLVTDSLPSAAPGCDNPVPGLFHSK